MPSQPIAPAILPREQWSGRAAFVLATVGSAVGLAFFALLAFATLSPSIAMMEVPVAALMKARGWSRPRAAWRWALRFVVPTVLVAILASSALAR